MSAEPAAGADLDLDLDLDLRALADANRRKILAAIRVEPRAVGFIAERVGLSQQTTSHHLGVLRAAGLAASTREGTRHLYAVKADGLAAVRSYLDDFWPTKLSALKAAVESRELGRHG
ncbi:DNA-binding transcriptional ArsR family regulator [Antricoccus suffuscus]|uniref:DNA-binding transcriptional ArsR family regulator n=1 Tax=Antricoccus suffuscus TaxID=1629062 RepID=A0A2T0ZYR8_9ACTN|nr:metalloregulator ArsR/SmtB family transcription factor [Antricoccus suffuscus]PRZ41490.1 DNA-binding transcriptional ArsR family regulator [Antricoccus suffuscus]